jgi:hypothetical protein
MRTTSEQTKRALEMVAAGATGYRAARMAGITPQALYQNDEYQRMISARRAAGVAVRRHYPRKPRAAE